MAAAEQQRTTVDVVAKGPDSNTYDFRTTATITTFPGFLRAYNIKEEGAEEEDEETRYADILKALKKGDACRLLDALSEQKSPNRRPASPKRHSSRNSNSTESGARPPTQRSSIPFRNVCMCSRKKAS